MINVEKSNVLHRNFHGVMPLMVRGDGSWLMDVNRNYYLDMCSSAGSAILGHSNKQVKLAIQSQLNTVPNVFGGFFSSSAAENAANIIAAGLGSWFGRVIFQNGGGEAVDLACKLTHQYHAESGNRFKTRFMALQHAFHGVGLLPFALTGIYPRYDLISRYGFSVDDGYILRLNHPYNVGDDEALKFAALFLDSFAGTTAAVVIEPIGGPPLGAYPHTRAYLQGLRELCTKHGVLLIFDEVLCGSGRCGSLSVSDLYRVSPDIIVLGKGLSAGYQPMSAICMSKAVAERISKGSGTVMFGTTNSAHTAGCAAIYATLKYMHDYKLNESVKTRQHVLEDMIRKQLVGIPGVGQVRGHGFLFGIELRDPVTNEHLDPSIGFHSIVRKHTMSLGCIIYTKGQTMNGRGDFITIAPPIETKDDDLFLGLCRIREGIKNAYAEIGVANDCIVDGRKGASGLGL